MSDVKPKTVTVSIELPEPPEGWEYVRYGNVEYGERAIYEMLNEQGSKVLVLRKVWTPPANAVGTFYPSLTEWWFTNGSINPCVEGWYATASALLATVFSDFTPPPERKPYRFVNGVEVKDGGVSELRFSKPNGNWTYINDKECHYGVLRPSAKSTRHCFCPSGEEMTAEECRAIAAKLDELNGVEKGKE